MIWCTFRSLISDFTPRKKNTQMEIAPPLHIEPIDNILPEEPLLMMGAGPVPIPARVAAANSIVINHLGDTMAQIIDQVLSLIHI